MRLIRSHRRISTVVIVALASFLTWVGLGIRFYAFPDQHPVTKSDVLFVIGPPDAWRLRLATQFMERGVAGTLMISVPSLSETTLCDDREPYPVLCKRPVPFTTQGEARWLRDEMRSHDWRTATVITVTPHVVRTEVLMHRCVPTGVNVIGRPTGLTPYGWADQFVYQTGAFVKVLLTPGCRPRGGRRLNAVGVLAR